MASRKKSRVDGTTSNGSSNAATDESSSPASPSRSSSQQGFVTSAGLSFTPLPELPSPSAAYLAQIKLIVDCKRLVNEELIRIAESVARSSKSSSRGSNKRASSTSSSSDENPWETPGKRILSASMELERMDYLESEPAKSLLYKHAHFAPEEDADKAALEATPAWKEVSHVLALYEDLRKNLVVRTGRQSKLRIYLNLLIFVIYTLLSIPLMALAILLQLLTPLWDAIGLKNHFYPVDLCQKFFARGFLFLCGIRVVFHGLQNVEYDASTIGMFSHASNLDPVIVASGPLAWKWIAKKSLFRIPVIGWMLSGLQHIPIERENREKAIKSLQKAAEIVKRYHRCIAVSPEGTRSKSGRIMDFKKGAFHTALQVAVPITPLLLEGAYDLWPSGALFVSPGTTHVWFLEQIAVDPKTDNYNALASKVRRRFLEANLASARLSQAAAGVSRKDAHTQTSRFGVWSLWIPLSYAALYLMYRAARMVL